MELWIHGIMDSTSQNDHHGRVVVFYLRWPDTEGTSQHLDLTTRVRITTQIGLNYRRRSQHAETELAWRGTRLARMTSSCQDDFGLSWDDFIWDSTVVCEIVAFMTRKRSFGSLHPFDPKIEKTLTRIRKSKSMHVGHTSDSFSSIPETDNFEIKPDFTDNPLYKLEPMENNNRTLKELATPMCCTIHGASSIHS
ncbi:hypothetical protein CR513_58568, partial [Mucuna pruriens]